MNLSAARTAAVVSATGRYRRRTGSCPPCYVEVSQDRTDLEKRALVVVHALRSS
jgi:hypothetical protein